ncbi:MAG TPA: nucleotidyltransferase domain-containing protein [Thermoanaerobaculia bacterium]|nr:nucleotidyltransferase domain-containing protein [Thermoanaerobaculia bacterium]
MTVTPHDLAETLRRRYRRLAVEEDQERARIHRVLVSAVEALDRELRGARLWLIGSLAHGGWGVRSDLDLVVQGLDRRRELALWRALSERLGVPVDLMRLEDLPATFQARVRAEGKLLHEP